MQFFLRGENEAMNAAIKQQKTMNKLTVVDASMSPDKSFSFVCIERDITRLLK